MAKRVIAPRVRDKSSAWVAFEPADAQALKAMQRGVAEPHQQVRAFEWILKATHLRDETFIEGKPDLSAHLVGMRSVGLQIVACLDWHPQQEKDIV